MGPSSAKPEAEPQAAFLALVRGRVQGVGFRYEARSQAKSLGLNGWVQNLSDGGVELWAEGAQSAVERYKRWLAKGPPGARVDTIDISDRPARGEYSGFTIEY